MLSSRSNAAAAAVASNNIVSIKKDHDLFDSEKKLKRAMGDKVQDKLTGPQKKAVAFNYCLLLLCMNKVVYSNLLVVLLIMFCLFAG